MHEHPTLVSFLIWMIGDGKVIHRADIGSHVADCYRCQLRLCEIFEEDDYRERN